MRVRYWSPAVGVGLSCSLLGGCAVSGSIERGAVLRPAVAPYEPDIPLPDGFRLVDESSEDWSSGSTRYVRHRYEGRADKYAVRRFYREQMPLVRWTPMSDGNVGGHMNMRFRRGTESCTVRVDDAVGARSTGGVVIEVLITPLPR